MSALSMTAAPKRPPLPPAYAKEMEQLWANKDQLSQEEQAALSKVRDKLASTFEVPEPTSSLGNILHSASSIISYPAGLARTAAASAVQGMPVVAAAQYLMRGKLPFQEGSIVSGSDVMNALKGQAQSGSEIGEKMGVPDAVSAAAHLLGASYSQGNKIGHYANEALGTTTNMLTDPATWAGGPIASMNPGRWKDTAEVLANPVGEALSSAGKYWHGGAYKDALLTAAEQEGKNPQSVKDWLWNNRIWGTKGGQLKDIQAANKAAAARQAELYDKAAGYNSQYYFDPEAAMGHAQNKVNELENLEPGITGDKQEYVDYLKNRVDETPDEIIARNRYLNRRSNGAYGADLPAPQQQIYRGAAQGRAQEWENAANRATQGTPDEGLGTQIDKINNDRSTGIAAENAVQSNKSYFHPVDPIDAGIAGVGGVGYAGQMGHIPELAAAALVTKKVYDAASSPFGRTALGLGAHYAGQAFPYAMDMTQDLTDPNDPYSNPWARVNQSKGPLP